MSWYYPELIEILKNNCYAFLNGDLSVVLMQKIIYRTEEQIIAIDEKWLRDLLFNAENQIEEYVYTIDEKDLDVMVKPIIVKILTELNEHEL